MSTQTVNIAITVNGALPAQRAIAGVGNAATTANRSVLGLRSVLAAFSVGVLVTQFKQFADTATRLDNRLNVLTGSIARSNELYGALFKVAQQTRTDIEDTVDAYARLERSTVGLNLTSQQLIDLTQGINQSFQIFGNSTKEASAALTQFGQGLSVGVLRGDELRSVLEQAPRLAKAIADGLNEIPEGKELSGRFGRLFRDFESGAISSEILAGGLRELGKSGKLTSEVITKGLLTQLPKLQEEFARTSPTIEDGLTVIQNSFVDLFRSPEFKNFSKQIGSTLIGIADFITANKGLFSAIAGTVFDLVKLFGELLSIAGEAAIGVQQLFVGMLNAILGAFGVANQGAGDFFLGLVKFAAGAVKGVISSIEGVFKLLSRGSAFILATFVGIATNVQVAFDKAFEVVLSASESVVNALIDSYNFLNIVGEDLAKVDFSLGDRASKEFVDVFAEAQAAAKRAEDAVGAIFDPVQTGVDKATAAIIGFVDKSQKRFADLKATTRDAVTPESTLNKIPGGKEVLPGELILDANDQRRLDSFNQRLEELRDKTLDGKEALRELAKAQDQYNKLAADPEIAQKLIGRAKLEQEFAELKTFYTNRAIGDLIKENIVEKEAAQVSLDHYAAQRLLNQALKDGNQATQFQINWLAAVLKQEREVKAIQQEKENVLSSLTRKADQYNTTLAATNQLLAEGRINEAQQKRFLADTELGQQQKEINQFIGDNSSDPNAKRDAEIKALTDEADTRQSFLAEMYANELIQKEEFELKQTELTDIYNKQRQNIILESQRLQYESASTSFGDLAELSKGFVKESSGVYKTLFAISKAFAIADGVVKLNQAILNASVSLPFPANLAAMAQVASAGLGLLASIKSAVSPDVALKDGGFVRGPGGPRDDAVSAALSNGEYVVNAAAASRNADLLEAINSGRFNAGQAPAGMTLNLTQNINGVSDREGFRQSGRQVAEDTARAVERARQRVS